MHWKRENNSFMVVDGDKILYHLDNVENVDNEYQELDQPFWQCRTSLGDYIATNEPVGLFPRMVLIGAQDTHLLEPWMKGGVSAILSSPKADVIMYYGYVAGMAVVWNCVKIQEGKIIHICPCNWDNSESPDGVRLDHDGNLVFRFSANGMGSIDVYTYPECRQLATDEEIQKFADINEYSKRRQQFTGYFPIKENNILLSLMDPVLRMEFMSLTPDMVVDVTCKGLYTGNSYNHVRTFLGYNGEPSDFRTHLVSQCLGSGYQAKGYVAKADLPHGIGLIFCIETKAKTYTFTFRMAMMPCDDTFNVTYSESESVLKTEVSVVLGDIV